MPGNGTMAPCIMLPHRFRTVFSAWFLPSKCLAKTWIGHVTSPCLTILCCWWNSGWNETPLDVVIPCPKKVQEVSCVQVTYVGVIQTMSSDFFFGGGGEGRRLLKFHSHISTDSWCHMCPGSINSKNSGIGSPLSSFRVNPFNGHINSMEFPGSLNRW